MFPFFVHFCPLWTMPPFFTVRVKTIFSIRAFTNASRRRNLFYGWRILTWCFFIKCSSHIARHFCKKTHVKIPQTIKRYSVSTSRWISEGPYSRTSIRRHPNPGLREHFQNKSALILGCSKSFYTWLYTLKWKLKCKNFWNNPIRCHLWVASSLGLSPGVAYFRHRLE